MADMNPSDPPTDPVRPPAKANRLQNVQNAPSAGPPVGMPPVGMPLGNMPPVGGVPQRQKPSYGVNPSINAAATRASYLARHGYRRGATLPYVPSAVGQGYNNGALGQVYNNGAIGQVYNGALGQAFNGSYQYNRSYANFGGMVNTINPYVSSYNSYGQGINTQYQNSFVAAAAENSRPAFESIHTVVQSFNAVNVMLGSTLAAMHMCFDSMLRVADNFTNVQVFMMRLYSTIASFRLARWFLNKLLYLLRMVRGRNRSRAEEELWASLSSARQEELVSPSDGRSWPIVVFSGILLGMPYLIYKLIDSVKTMSNNLPENSTNVSHANQCNVQNNAPSGLDIQFKANVDWDNMNESTIPLIQGRDYWTSSQRFAKASENGGWLLVNDEHGQRGFIPVILFVPRPNIGPNASLNNLVVPEAPNMGQEIVPPNFPAESLILGNYDHQVLPDPPVIDVDGSNTDV